MLLNGNASLDMKSIDPKERCPFVRLNVCTSLNSKIHTSVLCTAGCAGQGRESRAGRVGRQGRAGQGRAGQGRAGQGRAGQGRAGHLVSLLLSREDLLVELSALSLQVPGQGLVLLLQLSLDALQVVCCLLNLHRQSCYGLRFRV